MPREKPVDTKKIIKKGEIAEKTKARHISRSHIFYKKQVCVLKYPKTSMALTALLGHKKNDHPHEEESHKHLDQLNVPEHFETKPALNRSVKGKTIIDKMQEEFVKYNEKNLSSNSVSDVSPSKLKKKQVNLLRVIGEYDLDDEKHNKMNIKFPKYTTPQVRDEV